MSDLFSLRGKRALVTGGSRGIGLEIARGFVAAGVEVTISSRKADLVAVAAKELGCRGIPMDISTAEGCRGLAAEIDGPLHVLVNNAGATWGAPLEQFPDAGWDKVLDTNVKGVFHLTVALLPRLREAASAEDPARVLNIGSVEGIRVPSSENYSYSASKAALHMLTRHLAARLAAEHIAVNAIAAGPFHTKMMAFLLDSDEGRAAVESTVPLGRIGSPEDLVGTATFLCSRAGAYLTGTVIPLDGGITGCS